MAKRSPKSQKHLTEECHQIELSVEDSRVFVEALLNPQPVNERLQETIRRYRQNSASGRDS